MAAMASADVAPALIFKGLARQDIYGEIQIEASLVTRDIEIFGKDLLKVLKRTIKRSPSVKFQDFIQGIITTSTSGGSLKAYFLSKGDQYMKENRLEQKATLETLGVMAESFVTVVVAAPLFLIVMMSVMAMMGGAGGTTFLYIIIGLMIPLSQLMFVVILSGISVE
jgi:flagellar protein FlaJ